MAGATVKMAVDVTQFKKGIQEATGAVRTLDAQLKANEQQLKLTGDAEIYMQNKTILLKQQLEEQKSVVTNTMKALQQMKDQGVSKTSSEFQKMERNLANASGKMMEIQLELKNVETNAGGAKKETQGMNSELKNIGKGVAFSNLSSGLKDITDKLESGARAAVNFGKKIVRSAMDSTGWADDIMTRATQYGVDVETIQRMENVANYIDTDVDTIISAKDRLAKNRDTLPELLGISADGKSAEDLFWEAGEAIMNLGEGFDQAEIAQKIFGRSWREMLPLFTEGRDAYEEMMNSQNVLTEEQVKKLGEADDAFKSIELEIQRLKNEFWAENADTIKDVLQWIVDHADEVKVALGVIAGGFALIKIGQLVVDIQKLVQSLQTLRGFGGGGGTGGTGGTGGGPDILTTGGAGGVMKFLAPALKAVAPYAAGAAISAAAFYGIAKYASANNYTFNGDYNSARYANVDNPRQMQAAVRGILGANDANAQWQLGYLAAHAGSAEDLFSLFNYHDTKLGDTNWLLNAGGTSSKMAAAIYAMYEHRFGGLNTELANSLSPEWRAMLTSGQESYASLTASGQMDYATLLSQMRGYFEHYGTFNENGEWTIPGLEESSSSMDAAAEAMNGAAESMSSLPADVAAAVSGVTLNVNIPEHANGLFSVPWDGYPAILHKGERVVPERAANYNSNIYFGNVNLNNGLEIEALTESIDRRNRRQRSGYGS